MNSYYTYSSSSGETLASVFTTEVRRFLLEWNSQYTIFTLLSGEADFFTGGVSHRLTPGDLIIVNPYAPFSFMAEKKGSHALVVMLSPRLFINHHPSGQSLVFDIITTPESRETEFFSTLRALLARLLLFGAAGIEKGGKAFFIGCLHLLVGMLAASPSCTGLPAESLRREINGLLTFETMLAYVETNYKNNISLDALARIGSYNPNYISRFFKFKAGINFHEFLTRTRLRHSIDAINNTELSLTDIALENGFPSSKAFTRSFSQLYGITPSEYKTRVKRGEFSSLRSSYIIGPVKFAPHDSTPIRTFELNILLSMAEEHSFPVKPYLNI